MSDAAGKLTTGDARTVLPGNPVTYYTPAPAGCIALGAPIPTQPDPSKIIGVITNEPRTESDYPPIPEPGFYWAKCSNDTPDEWTVVRVFDEPEGGRWVENTVGGGTDYVHEWGPKLEPPR